MKNNTSLVGISADNEEGKEGFDSDYNCESVGGRQLDVCPVVVITDVAALVEGSLMCV